MVGALPEPRFWGAAALAGGKIYYGGGDDGDLETHEDIFEFDPLTRASRKANELPRPVSILAAASANGKVYFIGGNVGLPGGQMNEIVEYNPLTNKSGVVATFFPPQGVPGMEGMTAVTLNGRIYFFNGWIRVQDANERNEIYEFDPLAGRNARLVGELPHAVELGAAAALRGRAYLFGGLASPWPVLSAAITEVSILTWNRPLLPPISDGPDVFTGSDVSRGWVCPNSTIRVPRPSPMPK